MNVTSLNCKFCSIWGSFVNWFDKLVDQSDGYTNLAYVSISFFLFFFLVCGKVGVLRFFWGGGGGGGDGFCLSNLQLPSTSSIFHCYCTSWKPCSNMYDARRTYPPRYSRLAVNEIAVLWLCKIQKRVGVWCGSRHKLTWSPFSTFLIVVVCLFNAFTISAQLVCSGWRCAYPYVGFCYSWYIVF